MICSRSQQRYKRELQGLFTHKKSLLIMIMASFLISVNWLTYIYAVSHGQATQASLGYYIMPLVSILLSVIILRESLSRWMLLAILVAGLGVGLLIINTGQIPLISVTLAFSFGIYGLLKKNVVLSSDVAMLVESGLILPFALIYLLFFAKESMLDYSLFENGLLVFSGIITAFPLLLFAEALKRAPLNIIGFIQYINPTIQLLIALLIFHEQLVAGELVGFIFIWLAIGVFVTGQVLQIGQSRKRKFRKRIR